MRKLANYIKVQNGYSFKSSEFSNDLNGIPVIKIGNVTGGSFVDLNSYETVSSEFLNKIPNFLTKDNDILIAMTGANVGKVSRIAPNEKSCFINQRVGRILINKECEYSSDFIYYLLTSQRSYQYFSRIAYGAAQPNISGKLIEDLDFPNISPEQANKASIVLKNIDRKILVNTQTNQTLEQIAQGIFKHWFIEFAPVHAKANALGAGASPEQAELATMACLSGKTLAEITALQHTAPEAYHQLQQTARAFPSEFVESEMGLVPKGWEVKPIGEVLTRLKNTQKLKKEDITPYGSVPVFEQGQSILMGFFNGNPSFYATEDDPIFIFGDHTCVTHLSTIPFSIYQNVIPLKGKNIPTLWVYLAIQNKQTFQEYRRHWMELIVHNICVPNNLFLINSFVDLNKSLFSKKDCLSNQNKNLIKIRDTLLPKLLNGEIEL